MRPAVLVLAGLLTLASAAAVAEQARLPAPAFDPPPAGSPAPATVVFAGGCFWVVQAVFQHVRGVTAAVAGYAGGGGGDASYERVSTGTTGHAESVAVTFDPATVSFGTLLRIYFSVAHDPTELNRQGADVGPQYRSAIFPRDAGQREVAARYIAQLDAAAVFPRPITTRLEDGASFYPAESYHQNFATLHPEHPYIAFVDAPKLEALKAVFPGNYRAEPVLVAGP